MPQVTFDDWVGKYEEIIADPGSLRDLHCPQCAHQELQVTYEVYEPAGLRGTALVWCGHCLEGVALHRSHVTEGLPVFLHGDDHANTIPPFRIIYPDLG